MPAMPIFAESYWFSSLISDIEIMASKDFKMVPDKIKEAAPPCTPMFTGSKIGLFHFENQSGLCIVSWKNIIVACKK